MWWEIIDDNGCIHSGTEDEMRKGFFVNSKMNKYKAVLMHDDGKITINVYARNYQSAIQQIMNNENCPESAIKSLELHSD